MEEPALQDKIANLEAKIENIPSELNEEVDQSSYKDLYVDLGEAYVEAKEPEKALQLFENLLNDESNIYQSLGAYELGKLALDDEDYQLASQRFSKAIELGNTQGDEETVAKAQHAYAYLILQFGQNTPQQREAFIKNIHEAIQLFSKQKKYENLGKAFMMLTGYFQVHATPIELANHYQEFLNQAEESDSSDLMGFIHYQLGVYYEADENPESSFRHFEQALHFKNKQNITVDLGETYYHLGALYDEQGNSDKAFEYNVVALRHMLEMTEMSTHIGMAVIFLQASLESATNETLKAEAVKLLELAKEKDLMPEEETGEELVYNEPKIDEVLEQTRVEIEKEKGLRLEELKQNYDSQKDSLPENIETFAETAYDLLTKLEEDIDKSMFSFLARKKNKAKKAELDEVLKQSKDLLKGTLENLEDEQKESVEEWIKKIEEDFEE